MFEDFRESPLSYLGPAERVCGVGLFINNYFAGAGCCGVVPDSECVGVCFFEGEDVVEDCSCVVFDVSGIACSVKVSVEISEGELHFVFLFVFVHFFLEYRFLVGQARFFV